MLVSVAVTAIAAGVVLAMGAGAVPEVPRPATTLARTPAGSGAAPAVVETPAVTPTATEVLPEPTPTPTTAPPPLSGLTVALDPGHNGANAANPRIINAQVPNGRGGTKACNTVGTVSVDGYPEHAFTWDVAVRTAALLEADGAVVLLTRPHDEGVGPCVDVRGTFAQDHGADAIVSIHANGSDDRSRHGFFAIVSEPPLNESQGAPSRALAEAIIGALDVEGFDRSSSFPSGLSGRADLAGLNHAARPAVLLELGEMRNAAEAAVMATPEGRERYARAIAAGVAAWFTG